MCPMRIILPCCLLFAAACSSSSAGLAPQTGAVAFFEGARLITGEGSGPIEDSAFIVENDKFTRIGKRGEFEASGNAVRVDLTGKTVMPALIEVHTHVGYWKGMVNSAENYTRENILDHLDRFAYSGVAAVLSLGVDRGDLVYQLRDEPRPGQPLLRTAGRGLARPDGGPGVPLRDAPYGISTEAEARKAIQELAAKKVDFVKIWVDDRGGTVPKLTPPLYRAAIDEAHKHNLRVMAHVATMADVKDLVRAGIDGFAHPVWREQEVDDELIALFKQRPKVFVLTTLKWGIRTGGRPALLDEPLLRELYPREELEQAGAALAKAKPDDVARAREAWTGRVSHSVAKLNAAGVSFALGSDFGGTGIGAQFLGWTSHMELENLVAVGLTPAQAIVAATRTAAEILGLGQLGTVAAGKSADFIVLDANPLDNIAHTRRIAKVYLRGHEVNRARLRAKWTGVVTSH